jgi:hypothetical protein
LAETWRSCPGTFESVTGERVFPGPWSEELNQDFEKVYRETVDRLGRRK